MLDEEIEEIISNEVGGIRRRKLREVLVGRPYIVEVMPLAIHFLISNSNEGERLTSKYRYVREFSNKNKLL